MFVRALKTITTGAHDQELVTDRVRGAIALQPAFDCRIPDKLIAGIQFKKWEYKRE